MNKLYSIFFSAYMYILFFFIFQDVAPKYITKIPNQLKHSIQEARPKWGLQPN